MFIRAYAIKWDVDESDIDEFNIAKRNGDIPNELNIEIDDDENPDEVLADYISDETGWAVKSCKYEVLDAEGNPIKESVESEDSVDDDDPVDDESEYED